MKIEKKCQTIKVLLQNTHWLNIAHSYLILSYFYFLLFRLIFHNTVFNFKLFFVILFLLIFHNTDTLYILFRFPFTVSLHYFHSLSFFSKFINTLICHDQSGVRYSLILSSFVHFPYSTNTRI